MAENKETKKKRRFGRKQAPDEAKSTERTGFLDAVSDSVESAEPAIHASVLSLSGGMKAYENVAMIRIVSKDYNLLILKDYMPTIGKIQGSVQIVGEDIMENLEGIEGYYVFRQNQFELLIEEDRYVK